MNYIQSRIQQIRNMSKQRIIEGFDLATKVEGNLDKLIDKWIANNEIQALKVLADNYSLTNAQISRIQPYLLARKLADIPDNLL